MTEIRDSIYFAQLAKAARRLAAEHRDPVVSRYLRETAIKHDRMARELARSEAGQAGKNRRIGGWIAKLKR